MRARAFVTARLMETWAHGLDVHTAVGGATPDTDRLGHVAWLSTRALPYAYRVAGREPPAAPLRVELTLPVGRAVGDGPDAPDRITGTRPSTAGCSCSASPRPGRTSSRSVPVRKRHSTRHALPVTPSPLPEHRRPDAALRVRRVTPNVHADAFVAPTATLVGDVIVEAGASIWYGAVIRADYAPVIIRAGANVQENAVIHGPPGLTTDIGPGATVAHNCVVHGASSKRSASSRTVRSCSTARRSACGALIAAGSVVAAGADDSRGDARGRLARGRQASAARYARRVLGERQSERLRRARAAAQGRDPVRRGLNSRPFGGE